jgi:hypothetical protein
MIVLLSGHYTTAAMDWVEGGCTLVHRLSLIKIHQLHQYFCKKAKVIKSKSNYDP